MFTIWRDAVATAYWMGLRDGALSAAVLFLILWVVTRKHQP